MGSLSNLYISQSYQSLIHLATNNTASATLIGLQDGLGNSIGVSVNTGGNLYLSGSLSASLLQGYTLVGDATNRTALVSTSSFGGALPAGTISSSAQITSLGFVSSSITASSLITASFSGNTLTFTKGDSSTFGVIIPDVSGSTINTGSFVTTSSFNQYTSSTNSRLTNLENATSSYVTSAITASSLVTASVNLNTITFTKGDASTFNITVNTGSGGGSTDITSLNAFTQSILGTNPWTASIDQKFATIGGQSGSWGGGGGAISVQDEGTILGNATSFNFNGAGVTATLSSGTASITIPGGGGSIDTGSFATTGSNVFRGDQTFQDVALNATTLVSTSGSLMLVAKSFTSASAHLSASANSFVNLIFKNNSNTADTIISGSNNIFTNAAAPTAGFKRYIGGSNNIINTTNLPQISGSMQYSPTMANNYIVGGITMRGAVSSSTYTISTNIIQGTVNIGTAALNNAEAIKAGLTFSSNFINGAANIIANRSTLTQPLVVTNNIGGITLSAASSSIQYIGNIGNISITNLVSGSSNSVATNANAIYASSNIWAGANNTITATGSSDPGDTSGNSYLRHIEWNSIFGNTIGVNLPNASTGSNSLNSTTIAGFGLSVTGSNPSSFSSIAGRNGSAFFGRYNALGSNRDTSSETVFAVGTGTTTSQRKTGFLIDSGSNTFVEGTFNVSGSSTFTGSVNVTGSLLVNGISAVVPVGTVSSSAQIVAYRIFATTGSNSFNGAQTITGSITVSGSLLSVDRSGNTTNTIIGLNALGMNFAGAQPLAVGNTISVAIGPGAMRFASGSNQNVAIGNNALLITSGSKNFGMGSEALSGNTTGASNIAIGTSALQNNKTGDSTTAIGDSAAQFASGSQNTFIGFSSGYNVTGSNNVIIGSYRGVAGEKIDNNIILSDGQQNVKAQYSGSAWAFQDGIKLNKGTNKTTDIVSVNSTLTVSNSLVTANSIILVTTQNSTTGPVYPAVVLNKGAGTFDIAHNLAGTLDVAYLIINPT
jgi:hypothetical protein